jgi:hypothetical protein
LGDNHLHDYTKRGILFPNRDIVIWRDMIYDNEERNDEENVMTTLALPRLTARGLALDTTTEKFGSLRSSLEIVDDAEALRDRLRQDGYLYLPGLLDRQEVVAARRVITGRLAEQGFLDPNAPAIDAVARPGAEIMFRPDLAMDNAPLQRVLYSGPMMQFYSHFFGEAIRHYDFTWLRAAAPGKNSSPHCDIVYMGRGTFDVLTAWTPLGDIAIDSGALTILEGSHQKRAALEDYLRRDVDTYCTNGPTEVGWDGILDHDVPAIQERLGGRWLSADFRMGDFLTFTMGTVHASLDNLSNRIRLSSDSRYQRASEPADERWVGAQPIGHGTAAMRGRVC